MRSKGICICLASVLGFIQLCSHQTLADEGEWSSNGPEGGRIRTIAIHPQDSQRIYIGTIGNGVYQTTDGGQDWFMMEDDSLDPVLRDIAFHPAAPDTMYAATLKGMFRSFDAGQTWHLMRPPGYWYNEFRDIEVHPVHHNIILAGDSFATGYRSTDGGETWSHLDLPWVSTVAIRTDPLRPDSIYLATQSAPASLSVFRSEDLGETWYSIHNNLDNYLWAWTLEVDPVDSDILYLGGSNHPDGTGICLEKTTDAGDYWFDITPRDLASPWILDVAIDPSNHTTIYACTEANGVLKSADGGDSWGEINEGLSARTVVDAEIDGVTGYIYLATFWYGIYRSTDEGQTWQRISHNIYDSECHALSVNPRDPDSLYVATVNGLYRSVDGALTWQYLDLDFPVDDERTYGVAVDPYDPDFIYASYFNYRAPVEGGIFRSTDGGSSWELFTEGLPDSAFYGSIEVTVYSDGTRRLFMGAVGLYYSDNLGESWNICQGGLPDDYYYGTMGVSSVDPDLVFVSDWDEPRHIYRSEDGGQTWSEFDGPPGDELLNTVTCDPVDPNLVYSCRHREGVFRSTDRGETWEDISGNLPRDEEYFLPSGIAVNPMNPQNLYVNSSPRGAFISNDGGQSWEDFNAGLDAEYAQAITIVAPSDTNRIYLATSAQSVWSITRIPTSIDDDDILPRDISILSNYPNPFNSFTVIEYYLNGTTAVSLTIYDIAGRKVANIFEDVAEAGQHAVTWDARDFPSGVYFARLEAGKRRESIKMMLLK